MGASKDPVRAALDDFEWNRAYRLLHDRTASTRATVDELDQLATAAYLTGRDEEAFDCWARAHHACVDAGDAARAARLGANLAECLVFKGDVARASGWVGRVRHVLDDAAADCVEHGRLEHAAGMCRIFSDGDIAGARDAFARATKIAHRHGDRELLTVSRLGEGRCLIYLGEIAEGLAMLDEAMISVEAGEVSPIVAGDAYCIVIDGCHELFDVQRCETWADSFTRWCDRQPDLVLYRGHCLLHRAEILQLHGEWAAASAFARDACRRLAEPLNLLTIGGAHYVEADLRRLRGDLAGAEEGYEEAHRAGCSPQPGLSLLRLAQGRVDAAERGIQRALDETDGPIGRARLLGPYVDIAVAAGHLDRARPAAHELEDVAAELASPLLRAEAAQRTGAVLLADGEAGRALMALRRAAATWSALDAPYHGACTGLLISSACELAGDRDGADMERRAAEAVLARLGATTGPSAPNPATAVGLTARELEVLTLVARGRTNRAIAETLFVSEKTVTSHLSHIFTKLGLSSRSAATAFAYDHGLVEPPVSGRVRTD